MPCDQVLTQEVSFEAAQGHLDVLKQSLEDLGYTVNVIGESLRFFGHGITGTFQNGEFYTQSRYGDQFEVDKVKVRFGHNTAHKAALKAGWTYEETSETTGQVRKRSY